MERMKARGKFKIPALKNRGWGTRTRLALEMKDVHDDIGPAI